MLNVTDQLRSDGVPEELMGVVSALLSGTKIIVEKMGHGALGDALGTTSQQNCHGEQQKTLDVIANDILKQNLLACAQVRAIASEEEATVVAGHERGQYVVAFDPLDGSSNIEINGQTGTIFSIYCAVEGLAADSVQHFLRAGREQVCAGYTLYGPATTLVMTSGGPSRVYTLCPSRCDYLLTTPSLRIPAECNEFAINMANYWQWSSKIQTYIDGLMAGESGPRARRFSMRWNGAMVGDVHRILCRGGIFLYPSDEVSDPYINKLRLLYEAKPLAYIAEQAGGAATLGDQNILDLRLTALHQKAPVIIGSISEVEHLVQLLNR